MALVQGRCRLDLALRHRYLSADGPNDESALLRIAWQHANPSHSGFMSMFFSAVVDARRFGVVLEDREDSLGVDRLRHGVGHGVHPITDAGQIAT
jgi:hypothetical protein